MKIDSLICLYPSPHFCSPRITDKKRSPVVQRIVLETDHPYAHNADRKEMVKIEGARKLIVSFDERTRFVIYGTQIMGSKLSMALFYSCHTFHTRSFSIFSAES